jgi:hypothetical protein
MLELFITRRTFVRLALYLEVCMHPKWKPVHLILLSISIAILLASLIFFLIKWSALPAEIGMHFGGDGNFDVTASKWYGFYPHVIGGLAIGGITFSGWLIGRKPMGMKITEQGEMLCKTELTAALDILAVLISLFFGNWSRCVSLQSPINEQTQFILTILMFGTGIAGFLAILITGKICRTEKGGQLEDPGVSHRMSRIAAWMLTAVMLLLAVVSYERHPADDTLYNDPDYFGLAYYANFGVYKTRALLWIPTGLYILILAVIEFVNVRACKAQNDPLSRLTDKLRMAWSFFGFWWLLLLHSELPVGWFSVLLFAAVVIFRIVQYFICIKKTPEA